MRLPSAGMPRFLRSWAPHLTSLELRIFEDPFGILQEDISKLKPKFNKFSFPALTHLDIWPHSKSHYIHCFSECKELCQIAFHYFWSIDYDNEGSDVSDFMPADSLEGLSEFSEFITENDFPELRWIDLPVNPGVFPLDSTSSSILLSLDEFCKSKGIELLFPCYSSS
ncbi:uncharacterized protein MELLADRAFT_70660 [Melampsora larici-populina 98AG31]|uniref:Uncharacterized protein n=1 Tax=Melampsora larici-populina (strain 98AG31 / pathotype 3-4-7) TaxID=747676 RepID=F4R562_MELLP|nr:uncharacterized protein MELLADRAFT_70660 [Melampsora larici-populina 98AG31]EGG12319.1 hypothetical protein MELLADRAFT_70660 [Melampsora larici-populina 98AG31]